MAAFTPLERADAVSIMTAHGLGSEVVDVAPIAAGSVNSNYFVTTPTKTVFVRLYEEQDASGVAYEWALLDELEAHVPMPRRIPGPGPGVLRVSGRSVAVFERVDGEMRCQKGVTADHLRTLGTALADAHLATEGFGWRRRSRFDASALVQRIDELGSVDGVDPALLPRLRRLLLLPQPAGIPQGPIHGDLFRDNVLWHTDDSLSALLDWESAAEGAFVADLAVVFLSWCLGDALDWDLGRALVEGYESIRPLGVAERGAFYDYALGASARFTFTRITDFHLRQEELRRSGSLIKDYRRFVKRLDILEGLGRNEVLAQLFRGTDPFGEHALSGNTLFRGTPKADLS